MEEISLKKGAKYSLCTLCASSSVSVENLKFNGLTVSVSLCMAFRFSCSFSCSIVYLYTEMEERPLEEDGKDFLCSFR